MQGKIRGWKLETLVVVKESLISNTNDVTPHYDYLVN